MVLMICDKGHSVRYLYKTVRIITYNNQNNI